MLQKILEEVGLSKGEVETYSQLVALGRSSARRLAEQLHIPRTSVYDKLKRLSQFGLVFDQDQDGQTVYCPTDETAISRLLEEKLTSLQTAKQKLHTVLPKLYGGTADAEPRTRHFLGVANVQRMLNDILWHEGTDVLTMWPFSDMVEALGSEFLESFHRRRIRRKIRLRAIQPKDKMVQFSRYPFMGVGKGHLRDLRITPSHMNWSMGYSVYGEKVAFVSSTKESFGFIVYSRDFANLMRMQFEEIWKLAKVVPEQKKWGEVFLKSIQENKDFRK